MAARFVSSYNARDSNGQLSDRPVFDIDTHSIDLSASEEKKVRELVSWLEQKAATAALEAKRGPFRFLAFSAEVRNIVYRFASIDTNEQHETLDAVNFSDHVIPPIALANSQLHAESIPVFYGTTKLYVNVDSNLIDRRRRRTLGPNFPTSQNSQARSGVLRIRRKLKNVIKGAGNAILVRDITLRILHAHFGDQNRKNVSDALVVSTIRFVTKPKTHGGNRLEITVIPGSFHPSNTVRFPTRFNGMFDVEDIDTPVQNAIQAARGIEAKENFHGLTLGDLERIAKEFRSV